jgi:ubiquinone/menaquinone biosynthesis C-methylase UbiE
MPLPITHPVYAWELAPTPLPAPVVDPEPDIAFAENLAARDIWRVFPSSNPAGGALTPLTEDWFRYLDQKRYRRHGQWLQKFMEFSRHANESLLAVGDGLGFEWVRYAEGGADVTVVDPSSERLWLYRKHFAARGVAGQFMQSPFDHLPSDDSRIDVVCAVFNEPPVVPWATALAEAYRVLRPGGKILVVLPSKYDAARWQMLLMPWRRWVVPLRHIPGRFTRRELSEAFAGFHDVHVYKRHLRRSELPYLWRWMPLPVLERLVGRFLVVKAFKPLTIPSVGVRSAA